MIDSPTLVRDLSRLLDRLSTDLRARATEGDGEAFLRAEHARLTHAGRTAEPFVDWLSGQATQGAAAWILAAVFARFLEDNGLIDEAWIAGDGRRLEEARERQLHFFRERPAENDRGYMLHVFDALAALPGMRGLLDPNHNPLYRYRLSGDGATTLLDFLREVDAASGALRRSFVSESLDTRFLGDLYQDLSEDARKRFALLQTPHFIESFILDGTLTPAVETFGWQTVRLIDPACGSGHFLLGAFERLFAQRRRCAPGVNERAAAQAVLDQVFGVDLNPFAVEIARFRLLVAALRACGIARLADAPAFRVNVAVGDSLLHGRRFSDERGVQIPLFEGDPLRDALLGVEDRQELDSILGQQYHVVVGNPPYVVVRDSALNRAYRERYVSCHRQYQLVCPFIERFIELALPGSPSRPDAAGFVGMIVSNAFMKREFGKRVVESVLARTDLQTIVDTSGAYIPGHGTPTAILFARNRQPVATTLRTVLGIRGEPTRPEVPANGLAWTEILRLVDQVSEIGVFVSVTRSPRIQFSAHPWSIGGGGAAELVREIERSCTRTLRDCVKVIGVLGRTSADEAMIAERQAFCRRNVENALHRALLVGEAVRDWSAVPRHDVLFPYDGTQLVAMTSAPGLHRWLWPLRTTLGNRVTFSKLTYFQEGRPWWEWHHISLERLRPSISIVFAEVTTHNHFAVERGQAVSTQTAPIIKLAQNATEDEHLGLIGVLNCSTACFWMKQNMHDKGTGGIGGGIASEYWEHRYAHDGTKLQKFPLPATLPVGTARALDCLAAERGTTSPAAVCDSSTPTRIVLDAARTRWKDLRGKMLAAQEELDWEAYGLYGLIDDPPLAGAAGTPPLRLGERAFEIALARAVAAGDVHTTWFERHGSTPITEIPAHWPEAYRRVVARRLELIAEHPAIRLIEKPEYKRRWNDEPWEEQEERALREWLLDRLESPTLWPAPRPRSVLQLAGQLQLDDDFCQVAAIYAAASAVGFDLRALLEDLILAESCPFLAAYRYTDDGLLKRSAWEETWEKQRQEDAIDPLGRPPAETARLKAERVGPIPVPPKYGRTDFRRPSYWGLRGKLDVPKERFVLYPGAELGVTDPSPIVGWAGWDHLQQAQALAELYDQRKQGAGWGAGRLVPLLAGLAELLPWLRQWHNEPDPELGGGAGDLFTDFVQREARTLGYTVAGLAAWRP